MLWIPALSLQEQVERVGAYVGIASFFGIALLAVLYFAQARELKRLREWAGRAPERARELEERVAEDAARRAEAQAAVAPAAAGAPATAVAAAGAAAGAVAGEGATAADGGAVSAANGTAPDAAAAPEEAMAASGGGAGAAAAPVAGNGNGTGPAVVPAASENEVAPPDGIEPDAAPTGEEGVSGQAAVPPGAGEARGANEAAAATGEDAAPPAGAEDAGAVDRGDAIAAVADEDGAAADREDAVPVPEEAVPAARHDAPATVPGAAPLAAEPVTTESAAAVPAGSRSEPAGPRPATAAALRVGAPTRVAARPPAITPGSAPSRRRGRGPLIGAGVVAALALGGGAYALSTAGDVAEAPREPNVVRTESPTPAPTSTADVAATRRQTTVAVLNGTTTNGLAAQLAEKLSAVGYQEGPRGNYADQQRAKSVVLYREGAEDRARDVARVLEIDDVGPIDAQTAAQPIGDSQVVVIAGHDQAP